MPSQFDTTYNEHFRKPVFDTEGDKKLYQLTKEAEEVLEVRMPDLPTQEEEKEYMEWLADDFRSDPWVTYRFRKYTANPKRIPWKNQRRLKRQHQFTFCCNWALGSLLAWPLASFFARRMKTTAGGVPIVPLNRYVWDFPKTDPGRVARLTFRWYSIIASAALGYCFASYTTEASLRASNQWYNRPDLKPYPAMVKQHEDLTDRTMKEAQYVKEGRTPWKQTPLYRFFMGRDADYQVKENPYAKLHPEDVWDSRKGQYSTYTTRFGDHHQ